MNFIYNKCLETCYAAQANVRTILGVEMRRIVSVFILVWAIPAICLGASHTEKLVKTIHSPDTRPCTFFQLKGVNQADPITPSNGWFSVPLDTNGRHDVIVSMLLTAFTTTKPINVATTGSKQCGHAEVANINFFSP